MGRGASVRYGAKALARGPGGSSTVDLVEGWPVCLFGLCDQSGSQTVDGLENLPGPRQRGEIHPRAAQLFLSEQNAHAGVGGQRGLFAIAPACLQSGPLV